MLHISLAAEKLFTIAGVPITNSLVMTWLVMAVLFLVSYLATRNLRILPGKFQVVVEMVIGGLYDFFKSLLGEHIKSLFPLIATIFLFIITSNWMGLLPGVGSIGLNIPMHEEKNIESEKTSHNNEELNTTINKEEHVAVKENIDSHTEPKILEKSDENTFSEAETENVALSENLIVEKEVETEFFPILRAPTADLNTTLALGIIAFIIIQFYGFKIGGMAYGKKFINLTNPIYAFVGLLEIISDISKVISFAFRLFGNVFAGEVLLAVIAYIATTFIKIPVLLPIPFLVMEIFVGFIQALVFAMLVSVFVNIAVAHGEHEAHAK